MCEFHQNVVSRCKLACPVCDCDLRSASADACAGASAGVCVRWYCARYNVMPCMCVISGQHQLMPVLVRRLFKILLEVEVR